MKIKRIFPLRSNRDRGASAAEYAIIMGSIVAALVIIIAVFGGRVANMFDSACSKLTNPSTTCTTR